jgi:lysophospholipase L1-like esterase
MKHIFIFGASTVHGVGSTQGGWADRIKTTLYKEMFGDGGERAYEVYELGVSGTNLQDIEARFESELKARLRQDTRPEDMYIVFSAGVNDSIAVDEPDRHVRTADDFAALVHSFVHLVKDYTHNILAVGVTPVDEARTNPFKEGATYYRNQRLTEFEDAFAEVCAKEGVAFVPLMKEAPEDWTQKYVYEDGLHPNDTGYDWIYDRVKPALNEQLGRTS